MIPHSSSAVEILSYFNDLPAPLEVHTSILTDNSAEDGDAATGEAYESVWVQTYNSEVINIDDAAFDSFQISDTGAQADSLVVDAIIDLIYVPVLGDRASVIGFMDYSYEAFELVPIRDEDVWTNQGTAAEDLPQIVDAGGFSAIAPNPFNPQTEISFVLTRDNLTQLNVYSMRGELVKTLVNGRLQGGQEHVARWDGTDMTGQKVSSGTYFARLRIGAELMQVRKLMLVK